MIKLIVDALSLNSSMSLASAAATPPTLPISNVASSPLEPDTTTRELRERAVSNAPRWSVIARNYQRAGTLMQTEEETANISPSQTQPSQRRTGAQPIVRRRERRSALQPDNCAATTKGKINIYIGKSRPQYSQVSFQNECLEFKAVIQDASAGSTKTMSPLSIPEALAQCKTLDQSANTQKTYQRNQTAINALQKELCRHYFSQLSRIPDTREPLQTSLKGTNNKKVKAMLESSSNFLYQSPLHWNNHTLWANDYLALLGGRTSDFPLNSTLFCEAPAEGATGGASGGATANPTCTETPLAAWISDISFWRWLEKQPDEVVFGAGVLGGAGMVGGLFALLSLILYLRLSFKKESEDSEECRTAFLERQNEQRLGNENQEATRYMLETEVAAVEDAQAHHLTELPYNVENETNPYNHPEETIDPLEVTAWIENIEQKYQDFLYIKNDYAPPYSTPSATFLEGDALQTDLLLNILQEEKDLQQESESPHDDAPAPPPDYADLLPEFESGGNRCYNFFKDFTKEEEASAPAPAPAPATAPTTATVIDLALAFTLAPPGSMSELILPTEFPPENFQAKENLSQMCTISRAREAKEQLTKLIEQRNALLEEASALEKMALSLMEQDENPENTPPKQKLSEHAIFMAAAKESLDKKFETRKSEKSEKLQEVFLRFFQEKINGPENEREISLFNPEPPSNQLSSLSSEIQAVLEEKEKPWNEYEEKVSKELKPAIEEALTQALSKMIENGLAQDIYTKMKGNYRTPQPPELSFDAAQQDAATQTAIQRLTEQFIEDWQQQFHFDIENAVKSGLKGQELKFENLMIGKQSKATRLKLYKKMGGELGNSLTARVLTNLDDKTQDKLTNELINKMSTIVVKTDLAFPSNSTGFDLELNKMSLPTVEKRFHMEIATLRSLTKKTIHKIKKLEIMSVKYEKELADECLDDGYTASRPRVAQGLMVPIMSTSASRRQSRSQAISPSQSRSSLNFQPAERVEEIDMPISRSPSEPSSRKSSVINFSPPKNKETNRERETATETAIEMQPLISPSHGETSNQALSDDSDSTEVHHLLNLRPDLAPDDTGARTGAKSKIASLFKPKKRK